MPGFAVRGGDGEEGGADGVDVDAPDAALESAAALGIDRIELYTGPYAWAWGTPDQQAHVDAMYAVSERAARHGLELNAGHDLDLDNLPRFAAIPGLLEVSIGHHLTVDAIRMGLANTVAAYQRALGKDA